MNFSVIVIYGKCLIYESDLGLELTRTFISCMGV